MAPRVVTATRFARCLREWRAEHDSVSQFQGRYL